MPSPELGGMYEWGIIRYGKKKKKKYECVLKYVRPVKVQSYADDTTIIIGQPQEIKHVFEIYKRHAKASEAAINVEKTQIFKLGGYNVPTKLEHDDFTKKIKNKVTVLGAVFCSDKSQETFENLQKATKALDKLQDGNSKFLSLAGKILALNTYVFNAVWNNAWLIDIKSCHFKKFISKIERYLCLYKGKEIMEKVSTSRDRGGLGLINIKERIQAIQAMGTFSVQMVVREGFHCTLCNGEGLTWKNTYARTGHVCGVKSILWLFSIFSWCTYHPFSLH